MSKPASLIRVSASLSSPHYRHDCEQCIFLGIDARDSGEPQCNGVDMYVHVNRYGNHCLIRRYSSVGSNYSSFLMQPEFGWIRERYWEAYKAFEAYYEARGFSVPKYRLKDD